MGCNQLNYSAHFILVKYVRRVELRTVKLKRQLYFGTALRRRTASCPGGCFHLKAVPKYACTLLSYFPERQCDIPSHRSFSDLTILRIVSAEFWTCAFFVDKAPLFGQLPFITCFSSRVKLCSFEDTGFLLPVGLVEGLFSWSLLQSRRFGNRSTDPRWQRAVLEIPTEQSFLRFATCRTSVWIPLASRFHPLMTKNAGRTASSITCCTIRPTTSLFFWQLFYSSGS
ncbi:hypothetical protein RvY_04998-1 [Ramazzottius varieornatus]|uniref:Uncharacterized protein n=1 Tax=Ramazzottius varieornatus TaxID=947166 RepID=A0A1D1UX27_RAMVA|nr:hypothetical protein RvY_04998-1 [Ramazzottius varieornatus]